MTRKMNILMLPRIAESDEIVQGLEKTIDFTKGSYKKIKFRFVDNKVQILHNDVDINEFSSVWLSSTWDTRALAYAVSLYLDKHEVPHTYVEQGTSKISDQTQLALHGIPTPNSFYMMRQNIPDVASEVEEVCSYPLIIKDVKGSRGRYCLRVDNREELLTKLQEIPKHKRYIFQRFIPNDYDWGVLVANGKVVSAEKSYTMEGEFRNNACNGAEEVFVPLNEIPENIKDMAIKAAAALGLTWSRADIIVDKNTNIPYMLEVNRYPGITSGTTEVTGARQFLKSHIKSLTMTA